MGVLHGATTPSFTTFYSIKFYVIITAINGKIIPWRGGTCIPLINSARTSSYAMNSNESSFMSHL